MKVWKVIVATALIFVSGYSAGFFVGVNSADEPAPNGNERPSTPPWERRDAGERQGQAGRPPRGGPGRESREDRFINGAMRGIREKVGVSEEEAETIREILVAHQKEMRDRWAREISPIIDEEMAVVDQRILDALPTDEKRAAYRELMVEREKRGAEGRRGPPQGGGGDRGAGGPPRGEAGDSSPGSPQPSAGSADGSGAEAPDQPEI